VKVAILGSGVVGVSAAYYLAKAGHEVVVLDRQPSPGMETSFANAGEVSPGYAAPWAAPGVPLKALRWMLMRYPPLLIRPSLDRSLWRWLRSSWGECDLAHYRVNRSRMVRLAEYSRDCLVSLRAETGIQYDERSLGTLQLFRTPRQVHAVAKDMSILEELGIRHDLLDQTGVTTVEPALAQVREKFIGGLHLPGDETGDCYKFTSGLASLAAAKGVNFRYGTRIHGLANEGMKISGVRTESGLVCADAYLVALGSYSPLLLKPLGLDLPVYPVKGYSLSVPLGQESFAPRSTLMDETHKVAVTRLGDRIRVGGTAELAGYDMRLDPTRRAVLEHVLHDLFPLGGDGSNGSFWTGLRPMTPDGTPILGPTPYSNLYLNTGHGTLGWTMATGSGQVLADVISGRCPEIDMEGLTLQRYQRGKQRSAPFAAATPALVTPCDKGSASQDEGDAAPVPMP